MSDLPTSSIGEFITFIVLIFVIWAIIYGIFYGGVALFEFFCSFWGR